MPVSPAVAGMRQMTLPASSPGRGGASSCGSSPRSRRYAMQRSVTARSCREGLAIAASSRNRPRAPSASTAALMPCARAPRCTPIAAPTKSRKSGCGRVGRDLNSGWNCEATNHGWSSSSIDLDQVLGGEHARDAQPGGLEPRAQVVVDLVAVAVALVDERLAVGVVRVRAAAQLDGLGAQAHRPAHVLDVLLLRAAARRRDRACRDRTRSSWRRPCRRRCGRTRRRRTACRGRCRGTACPTRGRSARPRPCPRSRAARSRRG